MSVRKSQVRKLDLSKYKISYKGVAFESGGKEEGQKPMLIREGIFDQLIELIRPVSLKMVLLLTIYKKITLAHRPYVILTFKELAEEIEIDPCVLRRYSKALMKENLITFTKFLDGDANRYIFSMGSKFQRYLWNSKLCQKIRLDHVDNSDSSQNYAVHNGLKTSKTQSAMDSKTVHYGLPQKFQLVEVVKEYSKSTPAVFSSSSISMSSVQQADTNVSKGIKAATREQEVDIESLSPWARRIALLGRKSV